jgi:hypothetical protein
MRSAIKRAVMALFFRGWISHGTVARVFQMIDLKHS